MAEPTTVTSTDPDYMLQATGTNVTQAVYTYPSYRGGGHLLAGFSISTGALTACTMTILGANSESETPFDMTNDLFGVAALAANTLYMVTIPLPVRFVTVKADVTAGVNAVNFSFFVPKGRN